MKIGLLTVGTEILLGDTVNTNLSKLGSILYNSGFYLNKEITVSDERSEIEEGEIISNKEPDFSLDIFVHSESNLNLKDELSKLRFTINGKADIQQYCHNNIIPPNCNLIYKEILNWHSNTDQLRYNLNETYSNQFNRPEIIILKILMVLSTYFHLK